MNEALDMEGALERIGGIVTWKLSPVVLVHFINETDLQFVLRAMPQGPVFAVNAQEARHLLTLLSARAEKGNV